MFEEKEDSIDTKYLIGIGTDGFEFALVLDMEKYLLDKINGIKPELDSVFMPLSMRIRMNSHRRIKSYIIILPIPENEIFKALESKELLKLIALRGTEVNI